MAVGTAFGKKGKGNELTKSSNVVWHNATVTRLRRERLNGHKGAVIWFTGLSGVGKSTLAHSVEERLHQRGCRTYVLDGDNVRHGLCSDLGFSEADRHENMRRVIETTKFFADAGVITLAAFITPFEKDRELAPTVGRRLQRDLLSLFTGDMRAARYKRVVQTGARWRNTTIHRNLFAV